MSDIRHFEYAYLIRSFHDQYRTNWWTWGLTPKFLHNHDNEYAQNIEIKLIAYNIFNKKIKMAAKKNI